jgi:acetyl esterase/lipase
MAMLVHSMKTILLALGLAWLSAIPVTAAEPAEILLWPEGAPGSEGKPAKDIVVVGRSGERSIYGVHQPSITPFLPKKEQATGAAILVIPGGGHRVLAWDHEGPNLARWLSERGVAAFVLKYRLARETNSTYKLEVHPFADTRKAVELIRARATEWNIDPKKVGVAGFSAGGELAAMAAGNFDFGAAEVEQGTAASKPDFQVLIYPGKSRQIIPTKDSPPAFLACAYDDRPDISEGLAELYLRFKKTGVKSELHIYSTGGHGFGVRESNKRPVGQWPERLLDWMKESRLIEQN